MSVKVEANVTVTVKEPEVGDLFTVDGTKNIAQVRRLPSGSYTMCWLDGQSWGGAFGSIRDLMNYSRNVTIAPFKPGKSVTITQE